MKIRMPRISALAPLALALTLCSARADISGCTCELGSAGSIEAHWCGLCRIAEEQPAGVEFFFLKDSSPFKPNRWLLLPRAHWDGPGLFEKLTPAQRTRLWTAAIARARALWGGEWGLALNGDGSRTQCHLHIHIGKLLRGVESGTVVVVNGPAQIPAPRDGTGLWIHPYGRKLHVHVGEQVAETVLLR